MDNCPAEWQIPRSPREIEVRFGVSRWRIYRAIDAGELPHFRRGGRLFVRFSDWVELLERGRVEPSRQGEAGA